MNPDNQFVAAFIGTPKMNFLKGEIIETDGKLRFKNQHLRFDITALKNQPSANISGTAVELGIRSEDIHAEAGHLKNYEKVNAQVIAIELLGNEKLIYAELGELQLVAKFMAEQEVQVNTLVDFYFNLDKLYFFRAADGQRM
jgi:multiple sugar transport system ATP-binding protein